MRPFAALTWAIVPGPRFLPAPIYPSDGVRDDMVARAPAVVAEALGRVSGLSVTNTGDGDWWAWRAAYAGAFDRFELTFTLFDTVPPVWGGSDLVGVSDPREALAFWREISLHLPGVWLHSSDAELFSMEAFEAEFLGGGNR